MTSRSVRLIRSSFRFRSVLGVFGVPTYFVSKSGFGQARPSVCLVSQTPPAGKVFVVLFVRRWIWVGSVRATLFGFQRVKNRLRVKGA